MCAEKIVRQDVSAGITAMSRNPLSFVALAVSWGLLAFGWQYSTFGSLWANLLIAVPAMFVLQLFVSPLIATLLWVVILIPVGLVGLLVVKPFGWLMARPALDFCIKLFAFVCLIIGFHFDLLAS